MTALVRPDIRGLRCADPTTRIKPVTTVATPNRLIDLYSDTQTKPTLGMRKAMAEAEVGDEQRGEDPSTNRLRSFSARRLRSSCLPAPCAIRSRSPCIAAPATR